MGTLWVTDATGRLSACRTDSKEPPPLLVVGACRSGVVSATSVDVPDTARSTVAALLRDEPPGDSIGWAPRCADSVVEVLGEAIDLAPPHGGPCYVVPHHSGVPTEAHLRSPVTCDVRSLEGRMPEVDRSLTAPWVVAMVEGEVAAVCETARSTPAAVEAGVWTYEPCRRQGFATAVTAAWSTLVAQRIAFYSTTWDNVASQGVACRVGLRPLGHWWQLSRT